jgi:integrase
VKGFKAWLSQQGHAISSINRGLSTIRKYAELASSAGAIDVDSYQVIRTVKGYRNGSNVDERRETSRVGLKKAEWTRINATQRQALLSSHDDDAQGLRDALMMALLVEHGLRVSELAALSWSDVQTDTWHITVHRKKTSKKTKHIDTLELTPISRQALERYMACFPAMLSGPLLRATNKSGRLLEHGMTTSAINQRTRHLGTVVGVEALSPHDLRHDWTTRAVKGTKNLLTVQQAGGWRSLAMVQRYADRQKIANKGLRLED